MRIALFLTSLLVLAACSAAPTLARLDPALEPVLRLRVDRDPTDADAHRDLGGLHLHAGRHTDAEPLLRRALALAPDDAETLLYAGLLHEQTGRRDSARALYARYSSVPTRSPTRTLLRGRYEHLTRAQIGDDLARIRRLESEGRAEVIPDAIAIFPFRLTSGDDRYRHLGRALATFVLRDLSQIESLTLVERLRLDVLLQELRLVGTRYLDPQTAPREGRLLGAGRVVTGAYAVSDRLRVDLALQTSDDDLSELTDDDRLDAFFALQKDLVFRVLDELDISPTAAERRRIEAVPTHDLQALLAYGRALDQEAAGLYGQAASSFADAVDADPAFADAADRADEAHALHAARDPDAVVKGLVASSTLHRHLLLGESLGLITDRSPAREGETGIPCGTGCSGLTPPPPPGPGGTGGLPPPPPGGN